MDNMKKGAMLSILLTILLGGVIYYFTFPSINITNMGFWMYVISLIFFFGVFHTIFTLKVKVEDLLRGRKSRIPIENYKVMLVIPVVFVGILVVNFCLSPLFHSNDYYRRITVDESGSFMEDMKEVDFNKLPLLDRDSTLKIGDRTMGQMSELVSQFDVSDQYTQINYQDEILRVTPLEYSGFIKWIMNRKEGVKAYVTVDSTTGSANLVKMDKGMKYMPSGYFGENLYRKIQMSYPTKNIGSVNFEIDNEGNPYWIASVIRYVGVGLRREVSGVIILDPITGKTKYYNVKDVPTWVDHVYEADLVLEQVADWGKYEKGFWNSLIGQKGVVATTTGYNYLAQDDDVYLYTGITSVINDESNIGFILSNMRTKETKYYAVAGAEEYSAMDSAEGQVQQMNYTSTFPLLINLSGRPTYLVSLKDNAGLVKMYGFVDVVDYQKVVVEDSSKGIQNAAEVYLSKFGEEQNSEGNHQKEITIRNLRSAIVDGNTYYYFEDGDGQKYKVSIKVNKNEIPFLNNGDTITVSYHKEENVITVSKIIMN